MSTRRRPVAEDGAGSGPDPELNPRQEAAALALAAGLSNAEAARRSGAGERTIVTWSASCPAFVARVRELRAALTDRAVGKLADAMADAAGTLKDLLAAESESVRLSAARSVLELGVKLREAAEFEARISALEGGRK